METNYGMKEQKKRQVYYRHLLKCIKPAIYFTNRSGKGSSDEIKFISHSVKQEKGRSRENFSLFENECKKVPMKKSGNCLHYRSH